TLACAESNKRNSSFKNEGDIGYNIHIFALYPKVLVYKKPIAQRLIFDKQHFNFFFLTFIRTTELLSKFFQGSPELQSLLFSPHEFGVLMIESKGFNFNNKQLRHFILNQEINDDVEDDESS
ncbi:hypothetical protein BpHYR1_010148, partial [Brachionus plicatilis]